MRAVSSAASRGAPRSRRVCSGTAPAASVSGDGSMTITCSSCGSRSRTATIFATCSASSQTIARASEFDATQWHSSGEFVW
jgi:hypothetical protein